MPRPELLVRHPGLRWLAPVLVAVVGAAVAAVVLLDQPGSSDALPQRSAAQLVADVSSAQVRPCTGTVVTTAHLGLPGLPLPAASSTNGSVFSPEGVLSLLSGSHTFRVWYGGQDQQRLALLDATGEQDLFHDGTDLWEWNSASRAATHVQLTGDGRLQTLLNALGPQELAHDTMQALGPDTTVTTGPTTTIAGRSAYELRLVPRQAGSLIGSVVVAIDGDSKIPLQVQVFPLSGTDTAALDVSFTDFSPSAPDDSQFRFTPASDVSVTDDGSQDPLATLAPTVRGSGWTSVLQTTLPANVASSRAMALLPTVTGTFGTAHVLQTEMLSALVTEDGRLFVGAVDRPTLLAAAAAAH